MNEKNEKRIRHQGFWETPKTRLTGDPNIKHNKWNPYEGGREEIDYA